MCEEGLHDPFEDQVECARYRAERDMLAQAMERVADDIERTFLGFEGAEDAPAMRWAREFRAALGSLHAPARDAAMSAHDLLQEEEREAIAWVRERGGLDAVKARWTGHVPRSSVKRMVELHKAKRERLKAHALWLEHKCRERRERIEELDKLNRAYVDALNGVCKRLGLTDGTGLPDMPEVIWTELDRRLMPEGMEWLVEAWPRFEDGEPVRIGDTAQFGDDVMEVVGVELNHFGYVLHGSINDGMRECVDGDEYGVAVRRPAPKVLDADGAEIRAGETLYHVGNNDSVAVRQLMPPDKFEDTEFVRHFVSEYTHRVPVLAADGRPLREGETVWSAATGASYTVKIIGDGLVPIECDDVMGCPAHLHPSQLTHERPDSWERLEEDARNIRTALLDSDKLPFEVIDERALDIVRRAKALAERDA